jgi:hypothetical protein
VAVVRGLRLSSTWFSRRVRTFCASRSVCRCVSLAGTVSRMMTSLPETWSTPPYTLTLAEPLGSHSMWPRGRRRSAAVDATRTP